MFPTRDVESRKERNEQSVQSGRFRSLFDAESEDMGIKSDSRESRDEDEYYCSITRRDKETEVEDRTPPSCNTPSWTGPSLRLNGGRSMVATYLSCAVPDTSDAALAKAMNKNTSSGHRRKHSETEDLQLIASSGPCLNSIFESPTNVNN
mmetsp:Transcript_999/g.1250  ORF Transcript_999/g.1250 Transcript_999/m.1250 type:complete len:150 (+) Transcript_999:187-636(+)